jgi:hypothetical protein
MLGQADATFEMACEAGQKQHDEHAKYNRGQMKIHPLTQLRAQSIWPME